MSRQSFLSPLSWTQRCSFRYRTLSCGHYNNYSSLESENSQDNVPTKNAARSSKILPTHLNERSEKCPVKTCDYHIKALLESIRSNRTDVLKRHLFGSVPKTD